MGTVYRGDARGRLLGFPTANVDRMGVDPPCGVYAVSVLVVISDTAAWLTLVIARPLNGNKSALKFTSFIFEKIYSRTILVEFIKKIPR